MADNEPRYRASTDSEYVGHACCYEAAVVDFDRTDHNGWHPILCECFDIEDAEKIADALNARAMQHG